MGDPRQKLWALEVHHSGSGLYLPVAVRRLQASQGQQGALVCSREPPGAQSQHRRGHFRLHLRRLLCAPQQWVQWVIAIGTKIG